MGFPGSSLYQANLSFKTQLKGHLFWALPLRSSVREKNGMDLEQRDPGLPTDGYMPAEQGSPGEGKTLRHGEGGGPVRENSVSVAEEERALVTSERMWAVVLRDALRNPSNNLPKWLHVLTLCCSRLRF